MNKKTIIGIDFDNTIVDYDELFRRIANEFGFLEVSKKISKEEIRDHVRSLSDGEMLWQKLQGLVYGPHMHDAQVMTGLEEFLTYCNQNEYEVHVISHKTTFASVDATQTHLPKKSLEWLKLNNFFKNELLNEKNVFFEPTREKKIERIHTQQCQHFIDDLTEIFEDVNFPKGVHKYLFTKKAKLENKMVQGDWSSLLLHFKSGKNI